MAFRPLGSRLAALVLLLSSPGLAGVGIDAAHPCPEKAPWTVETGGHHHDQQQPSEQHDCKCVGACQTAVVAPIETRDILTVALPVATALPVFHFEIAPLGRPRDRLPPATAPPAV